MTITKIKAIKKSLDHVIDYIKNPAKTSKDLYQEIHDTIEYSKTKNMQEEQLYISTINCNKDYVYEDMIFIKKRFSKLDGILGFHAIHSFKEGEVTPEIAHEIGVRLAKEMWGDRFQVIVSTHLNTKCLHMYAKK